MKKLLALLLCAVIWLPFSYAEPAEEKTYLECVCGLDECVCFAQEGDAGYLIQTARSLLIELKLLDKVHPQAKFDSAMKTALLEFQKQKGLTENGLLDDMTLEALLVCDTEPDIPGVKCFYVPVKSGAKLHMSPGCSGMDEARIISARSGAYLLAEGVTQLCKVCCRSLLNN